MGIWGLGDEQLRRESYLYSVKIQLGDLGVEEVKINFFRK